MPSIEDWIHSPLPIIQRLYEEDAKNHDTLVKDYFSKKVADIQAISWIPSLNDVPQHDLRTNTLVRFRCMVQDMFDPEFYLGAYEVTDKKSGQTHLQCGKYRDLADCGINQEMRLDSPDNVTLDRQTLYCIPIPGETDWTKLMFAKDGKHSCNQGASTSSSGARQKRGLDENEQEMSTTNGASTTTDDVNMDTDLKSKEDGKKIKTDSQTGESSQSCVVSNFPLLGEKGPACIVKIYESEPDIKLNDVIEFIGIISNDPVMASFPDGEKKEKSSFVDPDDLMETAEEENVHSPPPSLVPRLHAVCMRKLSHNNPLIPPSVDTQDTGVLLENLKQQRGELIGVLQTALLGDALAAEYLLCHLVSTVYSRQDVVALGKFALNLSGIPANCGYPDQFGLLLQQLLTKCYMLLMSLSNMNKLKFTPRKDYQANRLTSGILQLSENTQLVVDETALQPGQLDTAGVSNMTALGNMIMWQKVDYDFNFHKQAFQTNVQVLVLSEGRSLIKCDCIVPVEKAVDTSEIDQSFVKVSADLEGGLLDKFRSFLTLVKLLPYTLAEDMQKSIEDDFVSCRKENPENMSIDDFHVLLVLARLLSLSHGETTLSQEMWAKTKKMEVQRKARVAKLPRGPPAS